jgi:hypothetical protein
VGKGEIVGFKYRKSIAHLMRQSTCNDPPLGYKREAKIVVWGGTSIGEDEVLLKLIQSVFSNGPVGLWKLRLLRGTPVCSRQTRILQPTAIGSHLFHGWSQPCCNRSGFFFLYKL